MTISLIKKSDRVAGVPDRWAKQYRGWTPGAGRGPDKQDIKDRLQALKGTDFTAAQVNAIIGNESWTELLCTECRRDSEVLVRIGDEPDYEAQYVDLCRHCIAAAAAALPLHTEEQ